MKQHNIRFLVAVHDFAEDGKRSELEEAIAAIQPPIEIEQMEWVISIFNDTTDKKVLPPQNYADFIEKLSQLVDLTVSAPPSCDITPADPNDTYGDQGMHIRMKAEVMNTNEDSPGASPGSILRQAFYEQGWRAITNLSLSLRHHPGDTSQEGTFYRFVKKTAEEHNLGDQIAHFKMGSRSCTMLGPELYRLCEENWVTENLSEMQPGERPKSHITFSKKWLEAITEELEKREIPLEVAFVKRKQKGNHGAGRHPVCLTSDLQHALKDAGIITHIPTNYAVSLHPVHKHSIPKEDQRALVIKACDLLAEKYELQKENPVRTHPRIAQFNENSVSR